jgi:hypothetical protein
MDPGVIQIQSWRPAHASMTSLTVLLINSITGTVGDVSEDLKARNM